MLPLLGKIIAKRRKALGLTQRELAHKVGFRTANLICMIEQGEMKVPIERAIPLAEALGFEPWLTLRRALVEYRADLEALLPH